MKEEGHGEVFIVVAHIHYLPVLLSMATASGSRSRNMSETELDVQLLSKLTRIHPFPNWDDVLDAQRTTVAKSKKSYIKLLPALLNRRMQGCGNTFEQLRISLTSDEAKKLIREFNNVKFGTDAKQAVKQIQKYSDNALRKKLLQIIATGDLDKTIKDTAEELLQKDAEPGDVMPQYSSDEEDSAYESPSPPQQKQTPQQRKEPSPSSEEEDEEHEDETDDETVSLASSKDDESDEDEHMFVAAGTVRAEFNDDDEESGDEDEDESDADDERVLPATQPAQQDRAAVLVSGVARSGVQAPQPVPRTSTPQLCQDILRTLITTASKSSEQKQGNEARHMSQRYIITAAQLSVEGNDDKAQQHLERAAVFAYMALGNEQSDDARMSNAIAAVAKYYADSLAVAIYMKLTNVESATTKADELKLLRSNVLRMMSVFSYPDIKQDEIDANVKQFMLETGRLVFNQNDIPDVLVSYDMRVFISHTLTDIKLEAWAKSPESAKNMYAAMGDIFNNFLNMNGEELNVLFDRQRLTLSRMKPIQSADVAALQVGTKLDEDPVLVSYMTSGQPFNVYIHRDPSSRQGGQVTEDVLRIIFAQMLCASFAEENGLLVLPQNDMERTVLKESNFLMIVPQNMERNGQAVPMTLMDSKRLGRPLAQTNSRAVPVMNDGETYAGAYAPFPNPLAAAFVMSVYHFYIRPPPPQD